MGATWRRAFAAVAAAALIAVAVVTAVSDQGLISTADAGSGIESIDSTPGTAPVKAASLGRQIFLSSRADHGVVKSQPILFAATLVEALLFAAAVAWWLSQRAFPARPALQRRGGSLFVRGPPELQLALIS